MPSRGAESWTVVGLDLRPSAGGEVSGVACERRRSPNTVRGYAHDPEAVLDVPGERGLGWDAVTLERLGRFVGWLRQPPGNVIVLSEAAWHRWPRSVNRALGRCTASTSVARAMASRSLSGW